MEAYWNVQGRGGSKLEWKLTGMSRGGVGVYWNGSLLECPGEGWEYTGMGAYCPNVQGRDESLLPNRMGWGTKKEFMHLQIYMINTVEPRLTTTSLI